MKNANSVSIQMKIRSAIMKIQVNLSLIKYEKFFEKSAK